MRYRRGALLLGAALILVVDFILLGHDLPRLVQGLLAMPAHLLSVAVILLALGARPRSGFFHQEKLKRFDAASALLLANG